MTQDIVGAGSAINLPAPPKFLSDHLANERTYLAYLRTAVSLMSFGIAINRFSRALEKSNSLPGLRGLASSEQLGIGMVALGMLLLVWAGVHYAQIFRQIERQNFRPRRRGVLILTVLVLVFGLAGFVWLFIG
jgi:putative membrane protein